MKPREARHLLDSWNRDLRSTEGPDPASEFMTQVRLQAQRESLAKAFRKHRLAPWRYVRRIFRNITRGFSWLIEWIIPIFFGCAILGVMVWACLPSSASSDCKRDRHMISVLEPKVDAAQAEFNKAPLSKWYGIVTRLDDRLGTYRRLEIDDC